MTALDEIVAHEEGMRFQDLAVILAKQRWPALVASERRDDLGLDAFVTRDNAPDGIGRGLACSITADYSKPRGDARKAEANFGDSIEHFVFSTPRVVSNSKKLEWAAQFRRDCRYHLEVISRQDLISDLLKPHNALLCRSFLGIDIPCEAGEVELVERVRQAAQAESDTWARRLAARPLIELQSLSVEQNGILGDDVWTMHSIAEALRSARRLILEGPAGYGKTTTLIQLASGRLRNCAVPLLVELPLWIKSGLDILSFVSGLPSFRRADLTPKDLARASSAEQFILLLNGWNEVGQPSMTNAVMSLRELERQFPTAGIVVATRSLSVSPPIPGATRLQLRRVGRTARSDYIRECLGSRASVLLTGIAEDAALDDLTRTPFVLAEMVALASADREIPRRRSDVIEATIALHEAAPEHAAALRMPPIEGMAGRFLEAIATCMMPVGAVDLTEEEARRVTVLTTKDLELEGVVQRGSSATATLEALCAHHLLVRFEYPEAGYRFSHQLYEEYYACRALERRSRAISGSGDAGGTAEFVLQFLNNPAWATPLEMLAERMRSAAVSTSSSGTRHSAQALVEAALNIDLVFAARLACLGGVGSDEPVSRQLQDRIREWYASNDGHHRRCALTAMLESGMDTFNDVVSPLLSDPNQQLRLDILRLCGTISPRVLGAEWRDTVTKWPEAARRDFVTELSRERFDPEIVSFGLADPSAFVRAETARALSWIGAEDELSRALVGFDDEAFGLYLAISSYRELPVVVRARAQDQLRQQLGRVEDGGQRLRMLLDLHDLSDVKPVEELKAVVAESMDERVGVSNQHNLVRALDALHVADSKWTSDWVASRVGEGRLGGDWWMKYVSQASSAIRDSLFERLATEDLGHRNIDSYVALVARDAGVGQIRRAFLRVMEVWSSLTAAEGKALAIDRAVLHQLESLFREFSPSSVIMALADEFAVEPDLSVLEIVSHLFGRTAGPESPLSMLGDPDRALLGNYVRRSLPLVLAVDDFTGTLKAQVACLLSQVGRPDDVTHLMTLLQADLKRMRVGRAARASGERGATADGAATSWAAVYVRAALALLQENADDVLLGLFREQEYERPLEEAYSRLFAPPESRGLVRALDFERVWSARMEQTTPLEQDPRRARVARAIHERLCELANTRGSATEEPYLNYRLRNFALGLAGVAPKHFHDEIIAQLALPTEHDAHVCVSALQRLLFAGVPLRADECLPLLDRWLQRRRQWGVQEQDRWMISSFLQVCLFVDDPAAGLVKTQKLVREAHLNIYDLRGLLPALGSCRCEGALQFMLDMIPTQSEWRAIEHDWTRAFVSLDTAGARELLLGLVDPERPLFPHQFDWHNETVLAERLAKLAACEPAIDRLLHHLSLGRLEASHRQFLAKTLSLRGTSAATLWALNLMDDTKHPAIPAGVEECIARVFLEDRVDPSHPGWSVRYASADNVVRTELYRMALEDRLRKRSAYSLLGQIEVWRLEYGRPREEPRHPGLSQAGPWPPPDPSRHMQ